MEWSEASECCAAAPPDVERRGCSGYSKWRVAEKGEGKKSKGTRIRRRGGKTEDADMNTDITASVKPEYPVVDRNPPFTKTVANFSTLDYLRLTTITGVSVTVGYLSGGSLYPDSPFSLPFVSRVIVARVSGVFRDKAEH